MNRKNHTTTAARSPGLRRLAAAAGALAGAAAIAVTGATIPAPHKHPPPQPETPAHHEEPDTSITRPARGRVMLALSAFRPWAGDEIMLVTAGVLPVARIEAPRATLIVLGAQPAPLGREP